MREYEKAADAAAVAKTCIRKWHKHLRTVDISVSYTHLTLPTKA